VSVRLRGGDAKTRFSHGWASFVPQRGVPQVDKAEKRVVEWRRRRRRRHEAIGARLWATESEPIAYCP